MPKTFYSHAFLVGTFTDGVKPEQLDRTSWKQEIVSLNGEIKRYENDHGYNGLCSLFYKAHLDSMIEADRYTQNRPKFLDSVHHFYYDINKEKQSIVFKNIKKGYDYEVKFVRLHIFTFPLNICLFSIEIDDTGQELNALTMGHFTLMRWAWTWDRNIINVKPKLNELLLPLKKLLPNEDLANLIIDGNKFKLFQSIKLDIVKPNDRLLYELGSSSSIGCIDCKDDRYSPSETYWKGLLNDNVVSTFGNWKGLALVDSFTMLGTSKDSFDEDDCNYLYFPLIYLRCLFEKTFCFSRNNYYREDKGGKNLIWEIEQMEKYYFYDNISYNFQPNLLYKAMAKGLDIKEEREVLSKQIKDHEEKRFDKILAYVAIFAVFSVVWDICSITMKAFPYLEKCFSSQFAGICILGGLIVAFLFVYQIRKRRNENLFSNFFSSLCGKVHRFFCIARFKKVTISKEGREHMATHFRHDLPGSKFYSSSPDILIDEAMRLFPDSFSNAKPDSDGKIKLSIIFPGEIGVSNVVSIDELTDEEKEQIEIIDRNGKKVRSVKTDRNFPTRECQIILSKDWYLITMFPGEMAPPLPDSPDIHDEYWDNHVFIEPVEPNK